MKLCFVSKGDFLSGTNFFAVSLRSDLFTIPNRVGIVRQSRQRGKARCPTYVLDDHLGILGVSENSRNPKDCANGVARVFHMDADLGGFIERYDCGY